MILIEAAHNSYPQITDLVAQVLNGGFSQWADNGYASDANLAALTDEFEKIETLKDNCDNAEYWSSFKAMRLLIERVMPIAFSYVELLRDADENDGEIDSAEDEFEAIETTFDALEPNFSRLINHLIAQ